MKKKAVVSAAVVACFGLMLAGCQNNANSGTKNQSKITIIQDVPVDSLDPVLAYQNTSSTVVGNTCEGLYTMDSKGQPHLAVASKVKTTNHGLTKTFTIRKNAVWSNGDPVTANDFVFAWRRLSNPKVASAFNFQPGAAGIKNANEIVAGKKPVNSLGVTAKGAKTLVVQLNHEVPYLGKLLSFSDFAPINQKYFEKTGKKFAQDSSHLLSEGPYEVKNWKLGDNTLTLTKNPKYWDAKNVNIKEIKMDVITDPEKAAIAYQNGSADYVHLSGQLVSKYRKDKGFKNTVGNFTQYVMFNLKKPGLDNTDLRKAISYSINRQEITGSILKDGSIPTHSMVMKDLVKNPTTGKDFADESTTDYYQYSPAKAKQYWNKAKSATKLRSFTLLYDDSDPSYANVAAYIKSQIEKNLPGMKVNLQQVSKKTRNDKLMKKNYDATITRWGPDYADPTAILSMYQSKNDSNYGSWGNAEFDKLMAQSDETSDQTKRYNQLLKANNILIDSASCPPLYQIGYPILERPNIKGLDMHIAGVPFVFKNASIK
ncbi:peptide ABC transporter substrate-binding protein [Lactobacillus sp. ESL0731]|uniref:peptide ABC transporter substrate-binding protein n=1 Tax=unclassified Lactobacillus TaxID=2620435 RepID=UPI0023F905DB|nr:MULTISPECIES: peptide ABC transporter substrate-binding protein [unclassified Lactobacillus]WEV51578.1 peptide ABC transporter substrate-binding protein [Lactobacillus sp. ESL0700]WEV62707.1 peptide ABC transporter substrate-binding protein [Lactobacillus sp. ESL0731]